MENQKNQKKKQKNRNIGESGYKEWANSVHSETFVKRREQLMMLEQCLFIVRGVVLNPPHSV